MSGKPFTGAENHFGQIGGLTARELQTLKNDMRHLFIDEDLTIIAETDCHTTLRAGRKLACGQSGTAARGQASVSTRLPDRRNAQPGA